MMKTTSIASSQNQLGRHFTVRRLRLFTLNLGQDMGWGSKCITRSFQSMGDASSDANSRVQLSGLT